MATKFGRRVPLDVSHYTYENFRGWIERSRENLGVETVDLVQLHCPPVGDLLHAVGVRRLRPSRRRGPRARVRGQRREGGGGAEGDRVPGRRHRPDHLQHLPAATRRALLRAGRGARRRRDRARPARLRPADGEVRARHALRPRRPPGLQPPRRGFDVGETFSGVDFETGLEAVEELRPLVPEEATLAQLALRWILDFDAVSTSIPGAKTPEQARANAAAAELPPLPPATHDAIADVYRRLHRTARCTSAGSRLPGARRPSRRRGRFRRGRCARRRPASPPRRGRSPRRRRRVRRPSRRSRRPSCARRARRRS